ncbi:MAG: hypothetical protein IJH82_12010 [Lachnospiraceae bacterium]|nr:hypothetical protein [Lachnospiraceae bacterium]
MEKTKKAKSTKKKKVILIIALVVILIPLVIVGALALRIYRQGYAHNKERIAELEALEGVKEVKEMWSTPQYKEKYMVIFEQPLDWSDPSKGTFPQRVEVLININPRINVMETEGYCLNDKMSKFVDLMSAQQETVSMFDGNYIDVEQRFFGDSRPADMDNEGTEYWEYLTSENSANDYHKIYTELSKVLGDKWIAEGTSRGGLMCNVYGYYFPDDMDVYVAYVAPCSDGLDDDRFYSFVNTEIGETAYGAEEAKRRRDLVTRFQVEAMRYKEDNLPKFEKTLKKNSYVEGVSSGVLYDLVVLDAGVQFWQYGHDIEKISKVMDMPENSKKEIKKKQKAAYKLLLSLQKPVDWATDFAAYPYYVGAAKEYGQYHYDFSFLRKALEEEGLGDALSVTEEMEENFLYDVVFNEEQRKEFSYDGSFRESLVESMSVTNAKHMMIFGGTDPWISVGLIPDETANENIKYFINPNYPHTSKMSNLPDDSRKEAFEIMSEWLGEEVNAD